MEGCELHADVFTYALATAKQVHVRPYRQRHSKDSVIRAIADRCMIYRSVLTSV